MRRQGPWRPRLWLETFVTDDKLFCVYIADEADTVVETRPGRWVPLRERGTDSDVDRSHNRGARRPINLPPIRPGARFRRATETPFNLGSTHNGQTISKRMASQNGSCVFLATRPQKGNG